MNRCITILCFNLGRLNIVTIAILPKWIYRRNALPIRVNIGHIIELVGFIVEFIWKNKWVRIPSNTFILKGNDGRLILSDFKAGHKVTVIKTMW